MADRPENPWGGKKAVGLNSAETRALNPFWSSLGEYGLPRLQSGRGEGGKKIGFAQKGREMERSGKRVR